MCRLDLGVPRDTQAYNHPCQARFVRPTAYEQESEVLKIFLVTRDRPNGKILPLLSELNSADNTNYIIISPYSMSFSEPLPIRPLNGRHFYTIRNNDNIGGSTSCQEHLSRTFADGDDLVRQSIEIAVHFLAKPQSKGLPGYGHRMSQGDITDGPKPRAFSRQKPEAATLYTALRDNHYVRIDPLHQGFDAPALKPSD